MSTRVEPSGAAGPRHGRRSLIWRTLYGVGLRIGIIVVLAAVLTYWHVGAGLEQQAISNLERHIAERRARESGIFTLASDNLALLAREYDKQLRVTDVSDARNRFFELFDRRSDGSRRLRAHIFDNWGITGFIGSDVAVDEDLQRRLVAAYDVLQRLGPAWASRFANLYVVTPEKALLVYWPDRPWALDADNREIESKLALLAEAETRPDAAPLSPETAGSARWSDVHFDRTVDDWLVAVTRPVSVRGQHVLSAGHDIPLGDLIERTVGSEIEGAYNLVFRRDGRLIVHPDLMHVIRAGAGRLTIRETGDPRLQRIFDLALSRPEGRTIIENPQDQQFAAVTELPGPGWFLVTVLPRAVVSGEARRTAWLVLLLGCAALLAELAILFAVFRSHVTGPLQRLMRATAQIAAGRYETPLDAGRDDEIGQLALSFATMTREIDAREAALNERSASLAQLNERLEHELRERDRAERELARHRELNALLNAIEYGILFLDPEMRTRAANRAFLEMWGIPEELVGRGAHLSELFEHNRATGLFQVAPDEWDAWVDERIEAILQGDVPPWEIHRADGRVVEYRCVALPDGGRMLTYLEVTEQKRAMEALHAAEQKQRRLLEVAPYPLVVTRLSDSIVLYANARVAEAMGIPAEEVQGSKALNFYSHPEDRERLLETLRREGRVSDFEVPLTVRSGEPFWALVNAALTDYEGEPALLVAFNDISVLKRREQELLETNREKDAALRDLNAVLDTIEYGILFLDADLNIRLVNRAYREIWGLPASFYDVKRTLLEDFAFTQQRGLYGIPDADWDAYVARRLADIRAGDLPPSELHPADGKVIQYQCMALPDGGRMLTYFDITELKRGEEALRRHLASMEAAMDGMAILDAGGAYLYLNEAHVKMFGYESRDEFVGLTWRDLYSESELARLDQVAIPVLTETGRWRGEAVGRRRDGSTFSQEVSLTAIDGVGLICVVRDITERHAREAALRASEERYALAMHGANEGLWDWSVESNELHVSPRFKELAGIDAPGLSIPPELWEARLHPEDRARRKRDLRDHLRGRTEFFAAEYRVTSPEGAWRWLRARGAGVRGASGRVTRMAGSLGDVTAERQAELELRRAIRSAEEASRAKSEFLANMSHELRTPMNAIIGFTRIVMRRCKDVVPDRQYANLEKILGSANHLLSLINDVLDLSKIEAGRMDVRPREFSIRSLIDHCLRTIEPVVRSGVELGTDLPPDVPRLFHDEEKLRQILINLLSNAAKFTEHGSITVSVRLRDGRIEIAVSDTGIGIPDSARELIFEEFRQLDSSTTRQHGGTGLGLSISRHLARLIGGDILLESRIGEGSTFTLTIPIRYALVPRAGDRTMMDGSDLPDRSDARPLILAIDDDPDVVLLLRENLGDSGYRVVGATHGAEGIRLARALKPFAITLDVIMPDMEGWEILAKLKADPECRDIPVVLLTVVDQKELGYRLGAADYLVKPFERDDLVAALERAAPRARRLLVADDDPNVAELVRQFLDEGPFVVEEAGDGVRALEAVERSPPDIMLLDLMMPELDGFGVLEALRGSPGLQDLPVIVLTAKTLTSDERALLAERVRAVIDKSALDRETLMRELRGILPVPHAMASEAAE